MNTFISHWELFSGLILSLIAFFGGRRLKEISISQASGELKTLELINVSSNFKIYQDQIDYLETRFKNRIHDLETDITQMMAINVEMKTMINTQENYISQLKIRLAKYEPLDPLPNK